jgi:four helix bundle protein
MSEAPANQTSAKTPLKPLVSSAPMFDHEKLDVYQLELAFVAWVTELLEEVARRTSGRTAEACDQLDRASLSALLNTAEGNGKRQRQGRAKFFDDARGSATECAACLDALVAKRVASEARVREGKLMLVRIVSMLCGLVERFDHAGQLRDEPDLMSRLLLPELPTVSYRKGNSRTRTSMRTRTK